MRLLNGVPVQTTILRDCVASFDTARHEQALVFLATEFPVYDLDDELTTWTKMGPPSVDRRG